MYGYEPPKQEQKPGCRDGIVLTRVAFGLLLPLLAFGVGAMALVALAVVLFATHWALGLLPLGAVVAGLLLLARRDRRVQREREQEIDRLGRPRRGPPGPPQ